MNKVIGGIDALLFFLGVFAFFRVIDAHAAEGESRYANVFPESFIVQSDILYFQKQTKRKVCPTELLEVIFGIDRLCTNLSIVGSPGGQLPHPSWATAVGTSFIESPFSNSQKRINCRVSGFSLTKVCNIPSPINRSLILETNRKLGLGELISYRDIRLLVPLHGVELTAHYDQLPSREASQYAGGRGRDKGEFLGGGFPPFWSPLVPSFSSFRFLKNLCFYAGFASCVLSLVLMSIHDQYELALHFWGWTDLYGLLQFSTLASRGRLQRWRIGCSARHRE